MLETIPRWTASFPNSEEDQRDNGLPDSTGRVQASAVIWARWAEGKKSWGAHSGSIPDDGIPAPSLAPLPNRPVVRSDFSRDLHVAPARMFPGQKQNLGSQDHIVGGLAQPGNALQFLRLLAVEPDRIGRLGSSWHRRSPLCESGSLTPNVIMGNNLWRIYRRVYYETDSNPGKPERVFRCANCVGGSVKDLAKTPPCNGQRISGKNPV